MRLSSLTADVCGTLVGATDLLELLIRFALRFLDLLADQLDADTINHGTTLSRGRVGRFDLGGLESGLTWRRRALDWRTHAYWGSLS